MQNVILVLSSGLALTDCASPPRPADPVRTALIERACNEVMGLSAGEVPYLRCVASLQDTLERFEASVAAEAGQTENAAALRVRRLEGACTLVGLDPYSTAFNSCIGNLSATLSMRVDD